MKTQAGGFCAAHAERAAVALGVAIALLLLPRLSARGPLQTTTPCVSSSQRVAYSISGEVKAGERFEKTVDRFVFRLTPMPGTVDEETPMGWDIGVFQEGRDEDLSAFTPPFQGINARHLYAWHFRNEDNTGPNEGSVNAPQRHREFIFSPEIGRTVQWEKDASKMLAAVARVKAFGQGSLDILDFRLTPPDRGKSPGFLWLKFAACLTWPNGDRR
jgi:hypothetical protein